MSMHRTHLSLALMSFAALAAAVMVSCGGDTTASHATADRGDGASGGRAETDGGSAGSSGRDPASGGGAAGGAGSGGAGGVAAATQCEPLPRAEPLPWDLHIMLDKSTSMAEPPSGSVTTKWEATTAAIEAFVNSPLVAGIGIGIQYFGLPDACDVSAYATPAVPIDVLPDAAPSIVDSMSGEAPETQTPMAPALEGGLAYVQSWAEAHRSRAAAVVLVTDGLPTECGVSCSVENGCFDGAPCVGGACESISMEAIAAVAARYAEADPPVRTFVIEIGKSLTLLDGVARAGGTRAARVDGYGLEGQVFRALLNVVSDRPCDFAFLPDVRIDEVRLIYSSLTLGPDRSVDRVSAEAECALNGGDGWWSEEDGTSTTLHLCPETCERTDGGSVKFLGDCPLPGGE